MGIELNKTCGNCKFRGEEFTKENSEFDEIPVAYFLCDRIKHDKHREFRKNQGAVVINGSGYFLHFYYAALCVESDFACNKWGKMDFCGQDEEKS